MVLLLGLAGAMAGAALFSAPAAQAVTGSQPAVTGSQPGSLSLSPASGASTLMPAWSTTTGCPAGFQASAVLYALNADGSIGSSISATVSNVTAPFSGTLLGPVGKLLSLGTNVTNGGTSTWVVACSAGRGGTGNKVYAQSDRVTLSADGKSYTSATSSASGSARPVPWALIGLVIVLGGGGVAAGGWQVWRWRRRLGVALVTAAEHSRLENEMRVQGDSAKPAAGPRGQG
jgi:hypothetical protein